MLLIKNEYIEGDMQVIEYTRDGETVSHIVKVPVQSEIPPSEVIPIPPTFDQRIKELETENSQLKQSQADQDEIIMQLVLGGN